MVSSASSAIASSSLKYPTLSASASESAASSARAGSRTRSTGSTPSIQFGSWFRHWLVSRIRAKRGAWSTPSGSGKMWSTACQNAFELVPYRCCSQAMTSRAEGVPGPGWICRSVGIGPQRGCQYPAGRGEIRIRGEENRACRYLRFSGMVRGSLPRSSLAGATVLGSSPSCQTGSRRSCPRGRGGGAGAEEVDASFAVDEGPGSP